MKGEILDIETVKKMSKDEKEFCTSFSKQKSKKDN